MASRHAGTGAARLQARLEWASLTARRVQDVTVENNVIYGEPAGHRAIGIDSGPPPAVAFSDPRIDVYQRPNGRIAQTDSVFNSTTKFLPGFNDGDVVLSGIKQVWCRLGSPGS